MVGDVSDKGTASGLFMAASKTLIKAHAVRAESTAGIVARVNKELSRNNEYCMFVTLFLAILDLTSGAVVFTNAGHNPPYLIRSGQDPELVRGRHGPALGVVEEAEFTEAAMTLGRGDMMVVHTDGVNEAMGRDGELAMGRDGELFGQERLEDVLDREDCGNAESVVRTMANAVAEFEEGTQQTDDVTVIAVKFHGT
ncbi:MAG: PP2C family protein-serine/threonine phosphatase [Planctomycetota bacterium]